VRLPGKVALITGAAAGVPGELMGFGGATAWLFVREGAKVVLADIQDELGERTAAAIRASGGEARYVHLDVAEEADWERAVRATVAAFGRLDILVNNAGSGARGKVEDTTVEVWDRALAVHARGAFLGAKHAIPELRRAGGGSIVNVSSIYGLVGSPGATAYHAAKGAVRLFTKAAAIQYAPENIRVNSVHPGYAHTPFTREALADPARRQWMLDRTPLGRFGRAEDIAHGILYLASDESAFVTGAELVIDGGTTAA
jgi:NAD(P)-dependent dehydrogenase (short-subunit alcohol dehydrogenase family)